MITPQVITEMQIKTTMRLPHHHYQEGCYQNERKWQALVMLNETGVPVHPW
jgi:hypothetical protein